MSQLIIVILGLGFALSMFWLRLKHKKDLRSKIESAVHRGLIYGCSEGEREIVYMKVSCTKGIYSQSDSDISGCTFYASPRGQLSWEKAAIECFIKYEFGISWQLGETRRVQLSVPKGEVSALLGLEKSYRTTLYGFALSYLELTEYPNSSRVTITTVKFEK